MEEFKVPVGDLLYTIKADSLEQATDIAKRFDEENRYDTFRVPYNNKLYTVRATSEDEARVLAEEEDLRTRPEQDYVSTALARGMSPSALSTFPSEGFGFPPKEPSVEEKGAAVAGMARLALPAAATVGAVASLPVTAPVLLGAAVASGAGAVSSYLTELLAPKIEGSEVSQKEAVSAAILGATPYLPFGKSVLRPSINLLTALGFVEGSELARVGGDIEKYKERLPELSSAGIGDGISRWGLVTAFSTGTGFLDAKGKRLSPTEGKKAALQRERMVNDSVSGMPMDQRLAFDDRMNQIREQGNQSGLDLNQIYENKRTAATQWFVENNIPLNRLDSTLASPGEFSGGFTISEILPNMTQTEQFSVLAANKNALNLLDNVYGGFPERLDVLYPEAGSSLAVRQYVREAQTRLDNARALVADADNQVAKTQTKLEGIDKQTNPLAFAKAQEEARAAALQRSSRDLVRIHLEDQIVGRNAANGFGLSVDDVSPSKRMQAVSKVSEDAGAAVKSSINLAYQEAGIMENDFVVTKAAIANRINRKYPKVGGRQKLVEEGPGGAATNKRLNDLLDRYFEEHGVTAKDGKTIFLTKESSDNLRVEVAEMGGGTATGNRLASDLYNIVQETSDSFIKQVYPGQYGNYLKARDMARRNFEVLESDFAQRLKAGDAEGVYELLKSGNANDALLQFEAYAELIGRTAGDDAKNSFISGFNDIITRGVLAGSSDLKGGVNQLVQSIDPFKLARELEGLSNNGFPVADLGIGGTPKQIRSAARLASVKRNGDITLKDLNEYVSLVGDFGVERGIAMKNYYDALRAESFNANRTGPGDIARLRYRTREAAKAAKVTQEEANRALMVVENDPLVKLVSDPEFRIKGTTDASVIDSLLSLDPDAASSFVRRMTETGKLEDLRNIRVGLLRRAVAQYRYDSGKKSQVLDVDGIIKLFRGPGDKSKTKRDALRAYIGDDEFNNIVNNVVLPLQKAGERASRITGSRSTNKTAFGPRARFATQKKGEGSILDATFTANIGFLQRLWSESKYNAIHLLYVDPIWSKRWSSLVKSGESLANQPSLAVALKLAQQRDEEEAGRRDQ